jgi:aarF domain-containing kinase
MQNEVPTPFKDGQAKQIVANSFKRKNLEFEEVFTEWSENPIGVASIGQVHKARLRSTGQEVAVKIMMPGIESLFRNDLTTTIQFCQLAQPQFVSALDEIEAQFLTEFDYEGEAKNMELLYENIMVKGGWSDRVVIPKPLTELCSKEVLVMEYLKGVKLVDGVKKNWKEVAEYNNMSYEELEADFKRQLAEGTAEYKNAEVEAEHSKMLNAFLSAQERAINMAIGTYNWTLGFVLPTIDYKTVPKPINLAELLTLIVSVHAHQILVDGAFNGDPHPGNIMLLEDGRVGLIDFGQVKIIDATVRLNLAKMMVAIANDDKEEIVRIQKEGSSTILVFAFIPHLFVLSSELVTHFYFGI